MLAQRVGHNMLRSSVHHVVLCCMMLACVAFSLKLVNILPTISHVVFVCTARTTLLGSSVRNVNGSKLVTMVTCSSSECEEFEMQSLGKTPTHGKRKAVSTTGNDKASKTRRWSDDKVDELIDMLEERVCLGDVLSRLPQSKQKRKRN